MRTTISAFTTALCILTGCSGPANETPITPAEKPLESCSVIETTPLGPATSLNLAHSRDFGFIAAGRQGDNVLRQLYNPDGRALEGYGFDIAYPITRTYRGAIRALYGMDNGYYFMSSVAENSGGYPEDWSVILDGTARPLSVTETPLWAGSIRAGATGTQGEYIGTVGCDTGKTYYSAGLIDGKGRMAHASPYGDSTTIATRECGTVGGVGAVGNATALIAQYVDTYDVAHLTMLMHHYSIGWSQFEAADTLAGTKSGEAGLTALNFFAENNPPRFTFAWLNDHDGTRRLRSFGLDEKLLTDAALPSDITDFAPVPGGYMATFGSTAAPQDIGYYLLDQSGAVKTKTVLAFGKNMRAPLITFKNQGRIALIGWVESGTSSIAKTVSLRCQ